MMQATALRATTRKPRSAAPARSLTELYKDFATAHSQLQAADQALEGTDLNAMTPQMVRFERLGARCQKLAQRVLEAPALSTREILLKLRVVAWAHADQNCSLEQYDHAMPAAIEETEAAKVLAGVQADLLRIGAAR